MDNLRLQKNKSQIYDFINKYLGGLRDKPLMNKGLRPKTSTGRGRVIFGLRDKPLMNKGLRHSLTVTPFGKDGAER